jgi:flagellar biosynthesis/type III secretory pathway chaperone
LTTPKQLDNLNTLANILQVYNTMLLQQDATNNDVLQELRKQNQEIIKRLERIENQLKTCKIIK